MYCSDVNKKAAAFFDACDRLMALLPYLCPGVRQLSCGESVSLMSHNFLTGYEYCIGHIQVMSTANRVDQVAAKVTSFERLAKGAFIGVSAFVGGFRIAVAPSLQSTSELSSPVRFIH